MVKPLEPRRISLVRPTAILTPTPDPFNQSLVAIPMYLLYEIGLLLSRFAGGRRAAA